MHANRIDVSAVLLVGPSIITGHNNTIQPTKQVAGLGEALRCAGHAIDQLSVLAGKGVEQSQNLLEDAIVDWSRAVLSTKAALEKRQEVRVEW